VSPISSLADLVGKRIGVAGSGIDKSWLLLQAYARKKLNIDLAAKATIQFGAAPLLTEQLRDGSLDAALNFWTQNARLSSVGFKPLISIAEVIKALNVDPVPAFVGFVWKEQLAAEKGPQLGAFLKAAEMANAVLATSDAAWERLKSVMKTTNEAEFKALQAAYRAGIVPPWRDADMNSAQTLMQLLIESGDSELVGATTKFDPKLFHVATA
jgi:NitT/TauT family transport system substrate-binding protein